MLRLLIIDNPSSQFNLWPELERSGVQLDFASTQEAAIQKYDVLSPEIVVVNLMLESDNAINLVIQLKRKYKESSILGITASAKYNVDYFEFLKELYIVSEIMQVPISMATFIVEAERIKINDLTMKSPIF